MKRVLAAMAALAVLAAGCTSGGKAAPTNGRTVTSTVTSTRPASPAAFTPAPATTVKPLKPGKKPSAGELEKLCPYIRTGVDQDPTGKPNVAEIQGNRIYRTTVLTTVKPVGCRFYFYSGPYEAVADIVPQTFVTPAAAHNALVRTAEAGTNVQSYPNFVSGVDGIGYQTKFFGPDGTKDWAFAFAKGPVLVVVHTEEKTTSQNALFLGKAIVGKF